MLRPEATGIGVVIVVEEAVQRLGWSLEGATCVVQGYGKVGAVAAHELAERGAKVVAVSDIAGGFHRDEGLDLADVDGWRAEHGDLAGYPEAEPLSNAELLELPCDVLVLAATENQVTGENAGRISARLVAEGANGPTSLEADEILGERGIPVLPDILTNAGGVAVSYFEWVQDIQRLFWGREEIRTRLGRPDARRAQPCVVALRGGISLTAPRRARHEHPRGRRRAQRPRDLPVNVREAIVSDPRVVAGGRRRPRSGGAPHAPKRRERARRRRRAARRLRDAGVRRGSARGRHPILPPPPRATSRTGTSRWSDPMSRSTRRFAS